MPNIDSNAFENLMKDALIERGLNWEAANSIVSSLIQTSLRGVDSHGINLFPHYYQELILNKINKNTNIIINQTSNTTCIIDANNVFGHYVGDQAVKKTIEMCSHSGIAAVSVKNSNHFGAAAYFTNQIADMGYFGFAFTNSEAYVNAHNTNELFLGTNPFCFSAPMMGEGPFCLDMATSTISWNKIKNYRRCNRKLSNGWALDANGVETTDPHAAKSLTSIGTYKGFGLAMVIEILCSGLALGPISKDIRPLYDLSVDGDRNISHFFIAIDISKFVNVELFYSYMKTIANRVRSFHSISEHEKSMIPGDKEKIYFNERVMRGIPIDDEKMQEFITINSSFADTII